VQRTPLATTRARARWNTARRDTDKRAGEQASRDAVVPRLAAGVNLPVEAATVAGLVGGCRHKPGAAVFPILRVAVLLVLRTKSQGD
jgi:hypothetical protein